MKPFISEVSQAERLNERFILTTFVNVDFLIFFFLIIFIVLYFLNNFERFFTRVKLTIFSHFLKGPLLFCLFLRNEYCFPPGLLLLLFPSYSSLFSMLVKNLFHFFQRILTLFFNILKNQFKDIIFELSLTSSFVSFLFLLNPISLCINKNGVRLLHVII